jgi:hypothetical protein
MAMNVAICLYGQPRKYLQGYQNLMNFISENTDCKFDFFFHTWYSPTEMFYKASPWRKISTSELTIDKDIIQKLIDLYKPIAFKYDEPIEVDKKHGKYCDIANINNTMSQIYSRTQVRNIFSQSKTKDYTFVVMCRFDFIKPLKIRLTNLTPNKLYFSNMHLPRLIIPDNLIIMDEPIFLKLFDIYDNMDNLVNNAELEKQMTINGEKLTYTMEALLFANLLYHYDNFKNIISPTHLIPNFC